MEFPEDLYYSKEHTWVRLAAGKAVIGVTDHAQKELGAIVFAELPEDGADIEKNETLGSLESSKTVAEVSALGLPALYVPLPIGNGEQSLNAGPAVAAGAALMIEDEWLTPAAVTLALEAMLLDEDDPARITEAARSIGVVDGSARLADMIERVAT
jgi:hypothetical protein